MFIEIADTKNGGILHLINLDAISNLIVEARIVGLHNGENLWVSDEDMQKILKHIEICEVE